MCRGRQVTARGGAGWGWVGQGGYVLRWSYRTVVQILLLSPENSVSVSVSVCNVQLTIFTAVLSKLHVRIEPALDDLLTI